MKNLFYILTLLLIITSCNKKWKKTSETDFDVTFVKTKSTVNYFRIDSGYLHLTNFTFSGNRKKGNAVSFSKTYTSPTVFDIKDEEITTELSFDIPQGEYTNIDIDLRFDLVSPDKAVLIKGFFADSGDIEVPFIFELEDRIDINIVATSSNASTITIVAKESASPVISFDLVDWFEHIPRNLFEEGNTLYINGQEYLYINKINNPSLYSSVLGRIGQTATITFN